MNVRVIYKYFLVLILSQCSMIKLLAGGGRLWKRSTIKVLRIPTLIVIRDPDMDKHFQKFVEYKQRFEKWWDTGTFLSIHQTVINNF